MCVTVVCVSVCLLLSQSWGPTNHQFHSKESLVENNITVEPGGQGERLF